MRGREPILFTHVDSAELPWRQVRNPFPDDSPTIEMTPVTVNTIPGPNIARVDRGRERLMLALAVVGAIVSFGIIGASLVDDFVTTPKPTHTIVIKEAPNAEMAPLPTPVIEAPVLAQAPPLPMTTRRAVTPVVRNVESSGPLAEPATLPQRRPRASVKKPVPIHVTAPPAAQPTPETTTTTTESAPLTTTETPKPTTSSVPTTEPSVPPTTETTRVRESSAQRATMAQ